MSYTHHTVLSLETKGNYTDIWTVTMIFLVTVSLWAHTTRSWVTPADDEYTNTSSVNLLHGSGKPLNFDTDCLHRRLKRRRSRYKSVEGKLTQDDDDDDDECSFRAVPINVTVLPRHVSCSLSMFLPVTLQQTLSFSNLRWIYRQLLPHPFIYTILVLCLSLRLFCMTISYRVLILQ